MVEHCAGNGVQFSILGVEDGDVDIDPTLLDQFVGNRDRGLDPDGSKESSVGPKTRRLVVQILCCADEKDQFVERMGVVPNNGVRQCLYIGMGNGKNCGTNHDEG